MFRPATVKALRLRQAVLRAVAVRDTDWEELELMNRLARLDAEGRKRILDEFVDRVYEGIEDEHNTVEASTKMMRDAFPELPQEPTERQVEAWVDLVELVQDEDFIARSREMAVYSTAKRAKLSHEQWLADQQAFGEILAPRAGGVPGGDRGGLRGGRGAGDGDVRGLVHEAGQAR